MLDATLGRMPEKLIAILSDGTEHEIVLSDGVTADQTMRTLTDSRGEAIRAGEWLSTTRHERIRTSAVIRYRVES